MSVKHLLLVCLAAAALRFVFPSEVPFHVDESALFQRAVDQNAAGAWTTHGLRGTRGFDYGPVPILLYRGALSLSHDPVVLVLLKVFFVTTLTLIAVLWLIRLCPWLWYWTAGVPFLSPYLWIYSRDLWDNSFNVPITALLFVSYLAFVKEHRRRWLLLCALCTTAVLQIHLLCIPLVAAVFLHFAIFERAWWRRHPAAPVAALALCALLLAPYVVHLVRTFRTLVPLPFGWGVLHVFFGPLGGRLFTAVGVEYFFGAGWFLRLPWQGLWLGAVVTTVSLFGGLATFYGMFLAARRLRSRKLRGVEFAGDFVALTAIGLHVFLVGFQQLINHPHYYGAVWIGFLYCLGLGLQELSGWPIWRRGVQAYTVCLAASLLLMIALVHSGMEGHKGRYGHRIGERSLPELLGR